jgi:four helix bundle protein
MDGNAHGYRGLRVWHDGMDLTLEVYGLTRSFPRHELFGLASQMQRAASSVPANIAEGRSRESPGDYGRFIRIALGSLGELETFLELAMRLDYIQRDQSQAAIERCASVRRQLHRLLTFVESQRDQRGASGQ